MFIHLTNYAVNKKNKLFSVDESGATGHKRRITLLCKLKYLNQFWF